jgi:hypothetical protein
MSQQLNRLPDFSTPLMDKKGTTNASWFRLLQGLFSGAPTGNLSVVTPGSSPYTYAAPVGGTLIVNGGTVSQIKYSRDGANFYVTGQTAGMLPLSQGDQLVISYSVPPTLTFAPK